MRRLFFLITLVFLLSACGEGVDEEVLESLSTALDIRWEYTETLPSEVSVEELERAVKIELENLPSYEYDDFNSGDLFVLYNSYIMDLELIQTLMTGKSANDLAFQKQWEDHMNQRKITLYEINEEAEINVSENNKHILKELIDEGENLYENKDIYEYVEQMTYRVHEALRFTNGSFEQRSSLNAAEKRANTVIEDVRDNIVDENLVELFEDLKTTVELAVKEGLEENYYSLESYIEVIDEIALEIKEY